ncbi:hypothetical protein ACIO52_31985 [Nocardia sp. NPDC087230]|uniref:hypothetical protein n=1 Tax=Nocardia sp. NPDC087230 TaxID=3364331 RepID=UPI0037F96B83
MQTQPNIEPHDETRFAEEPAPQARITSVIRSIVFEFLWTDESEAHIARHNVTPSEVEEAARKPNFTTDGVNNTTLVFGQTYAGRYLKVVTAEAMDGRTYVVTAMEMSDSEQRFFRRKVT